MTGLQADLDLLSQNISSSTSGSSTALVAIQSDISLIKAKDVSQDLVITTIQSDISLIKATGVTQSLDITNIKAKNVDQDTNITNIIATNSDQQVSLNNLTTDVSTTKGYFTANKLKLGNLTNSTTYGVLVNDSTNTLSY